MEVMITLVNDSINRILCDSNNNMKIKLSLSISISLSLSPCLSIYLSIYLLVSLSLSLLLILALLPQYLLLFIFFSLFSFSYLSLWKFLLILAILLSTCLPVCSFVKQIETITLSYLPYNLALCTYLFYFIYEPCLRTECLNDFNTSYAHLLIFNSYYPPSPSFSYFLWHNLMFIYSLYSS